MLYDISVCTCKEKIEKHFNNLIYQIDLAEKHFNNLVYQIDLAAIFNAISLDAFYFVQ